MVRGPEEVVRSAYELLLGREPEPAGLKHWATALENGLSQEQFVREMLASAEFRMKWAGPESAATSHDDVDLIIPVRGHQLRVPAADKALVPHLLNDRCWEPHLTSFLLRELQPSHVFVDVGANIGYFTVLCAPLVTRVVAFEPVTRNYGYCQANIALNRLTNVDLHQFGLWHEDTELPLRNDSVGVNAAIAPGDEAASSNSIKLVSLDNMIRTGRLDIPRLDVLKMDVEGAEMSALIGMSGAIAQFRPRIVMELNPPMLATFGVTIENVWDFLRDLEYEIRAFEPWQERDPMPVHDIDELKRLCPWGSLIDVVATVRR